MGKNWRYLCRFNKNSLAFLIIKINVEPITSQVQSSEDCDKKGTPKPNRNKPQVGEQHKRQNISSEVAQAFRSAEDFWSADYNIGYNALHTDATKTDDRIFPFRNRVVLAV